MKEINCLDCDELFKAETSDEMLKTLLPHYMTVHKDIMSNLTDEIKEDWMKRFHEKWNNAIEINKNKK